MPKSKRSKVFNLTQTEKKGKDAKTTLFEELREAVDTYTHIYLFSVENMRNNIIKDVRTEWKSSRFVRVKIHGDRFFFGKNRVMAKALGETLEQEYRNNLSTLAQKLTGNVGLLFSNEAPEKVKSYFDEFRVKDYARSGCVATETVTLAQGPLFRGEEKIPHNMEVQLRKLELPTMLVSGVVTLSREHVVCREGEKLTPEQAQILKLFYIQMAEFKLDILGYWTNDAFTSLEDSEMATI